MAAQRKAAAVKALHIVTAVLEGGVGAALVLAPSAVARILLGAPLVGLAATAVGRVAGTALVALAVACWFARQDVRSRAARGLVVALTVYNAGVVAILIAAGVQAQPVGIALWPAVAGHVVMGIWCVGCLLPKPPA